MVGRLRRGFGALHNKRVNGKNAQKKNKKRRIEMTMSANDKNRLAIDEFQNVQFKIYK